jgi:hypothetical protein
MEKQSIEVLFITETLGTEDREKEIRKVFTDCDVMYKGTKKKKGEKYTGRGLRSEEEARARGEPPAPMDTASDSAVAEHELWATTHFRTLQEQPQQPRAAELEQPMQERKQVEHARESAQPQEQPQQPQQSQQPQQQQQRQQQQERPRPRFTQTVRIMVGERRDVRPNLRDATPGSRVYISQGPEEVARAGKIARGQPYIPAVATAEWAETKMEDLIFNRNNPLWLTITGESRVKWCSKWEKKKNHRRHRFVRLPGWNLGDRGTKRPGEQAAGSGRIHKDKHHFKSRH